MIKDSNNVTIVNLTNHDINLYPYDTVDIPIPVRKSDETEFLGKCILLKSLGHSRAQIYRDNSNVKIKVKSSVKSVPLSTTNIGIIDGLPDEKDDTILIISQLTYNAIFHIRKDVFMIDSPIRSEGGRVIACRSFSRCFYEDHVKPLQSTIKYLNQRLVQINADNVMERNQLMGCLIELNSYIKK